MIKFFEWFILTIIMSTVWGVMYVKFNTSFEALVFSGIAMIYCRLVVYK